MKYAVNKSLQLGSAGILHVSLTNGSIPNKLENVLLPVM
ncbi:protein of unknown function [Xenorhabdus doucetiae]|uniref:Uncharacterized protein n=1 Tax=Xenorhabdus doucetiae TaxID=351671 RepID=A0A068QUK8_9GAMM|nr:protein of unknown function [Xenorhabdus doucetiae]